MSTIQKTNHSWLLLVGLALIAPALASPTLDPALSNDSTEQLTMGALVQAVVAQNPGLAEMRATASAAEQRIVPAGALEDPFLSYALAPATLNSRITPTGESNGLNQRIEVSQSFPWPGKLGLREDAARLEADAAGIDIDTTRLRLVARSKASYTQWYYIHQALDVNAANLELLEELRMVAENRYASGLASQQDVLQAEVRIQELQRQRLDMNRVQEQVAAQINALLSRTPGAPVLAPSVLPPLSGVPDVAVIQDIAITHHPELATIERMMAANAVREKLAKKEFLPDFKVSTGYDRLWDETDKRWTIGVGINVPIGRDKRHAALAEAKANTQRYQYQLDDRRAQLMGELRQAHAALKQAWKTIRLYQHELTPRTRENLSAARAEYGSGGGSFLDVITAEEQKLNAELGIEQAMADYFIALAELERWAGGELPPSDVADSKQ